MTALTRGPLPASVYWRRRLVLLSLVLALVVGTVVLVRSLAGSGGPEGPDQASQVAAEPRERRAERRVRERTRAPAIPSEARSERERRRETRQREREQVLAEPEGVCSDRDVAVTPSVPDPYGGAPIEIVLELRTAETPACTWRVSPATLTVKLTSGDDDIWTSTDCPGAIPTEDVVIRSAVATEVGVTWSARRSDDECSTRTDWALPGWYHVNAAALAGEPSDLQFQLLREREEAQEPAEPREEKKQEGRGRDGRVERGARDSGQAERGARGREREGDSAGRSRGNG